MITIAIETAAINVREWEKIATSSRAEASDELSRRAFSTLDAARYTLARLIAERDAYQEQSARHISNFAFIGTFNLPEWALSYIHYGDDSGIEQSDAAQVDEWLASFADHHKLSFNPLDMDSGFTHSPAFGLACDCEKTEVWGHRKGYHAN